MRKLRKEAPVTLDKFDGSGKVIFDEDSLAIKCLTSKGKEYKKMGSLSRKQAKIFVCQRKFIICMQFLLGQLRL